MPAGAALGLGQLRHLDELGPLDPLDDQLGDPLAPAEMQRMRWGRD